MNEQQIFNLTSEEYFYLDDFCISESNKLVYEYLFRWPKWSDKILNISGPKKSGKTFLLTTFAKKFNFFKVACKDLNVENIDEYTKLDRLIIEDISPINENILFLIFNDFKLNDKFLIFSSEFCLSSINFGLKDLSSRFKSLLNLEILNPSDNLLYKIFLKQISSKQIKMSTNLIKYTLKRIERTYEAINKCVSDIDRENLINKKKIDLKLINKVISNQLK